VPPFIRHIIMPDVHQSACFARQGVLNGHLGSAAITGSGHIQRRMVVPVPHPLSQHSSLKEDLSQPVGEVDKRSIYIKTTKMPINSFVLFHPLQHTDN